MPLGPGSRLDAYELLQPLGAGGMGEVWLATEVRLGRKLALKLLPSDLTRDPARVSRFEQEARAASTLGERSSPSSSWNWTSTIASSCMNRAASSWTVARACARVESDIPIADRCGTQRRIEGHDRAR